MSTTGFRINGIFQEFTIYIRDNTALKKSTQVTGSTELWAVEITDMIFNLTQCEDWPTFTFISVTYQLITIDITHALKNVAWDGKNNSLHKVWSLPGKAYCLFLYLEILHLSTLNSVLVLSPLRGSDNLWAAGPGATPYWPLFVDPVGVHRAGLTREGRQWKRSGNKFNNFFNFVVLDLKKLFSTVIKSCLIWMESLDFSVQVCFIL